MIRFSKMHAFPLSLWLGIGILLMVFVLVFVAPSISSHDPVQQDVELRLQGPSEDHLLGTDRFGRDVLVRTLFGGQTTLVSAFLTLGIVVCVGVAVGLFTGMFHNSWLDIVFMRIIDVLIAFPFMVFAMVITALFGTGLLHLLCAVCIVWWAPFARLTRSIVLQIKNDTSVEAAKVLGASHLTIVVKELLPKVMSSVAIQATFELGTLILSISALSFLGLGSQPPAPEWGSMLADGRDHFFEAPHILMSPAIFIMLTVLALNFIGEGLRDRLDPYEKLQM